MDLSGLRWTKNINHKGNDKYWAYQDIEQDLKRFHLNWRTEQKDNASKPNKGDLILLRQRAKVTHIVEILDNKPKQYEENTVTEFSIYRLVQTIWITDDWNFPPESNIVFGYHVHLQGGKVMKLETLPTFKKHWDSQGGLSEFQNHILKILKLDKQ
ncbi:MAG: hypothetical protein KME52_10965 [Desmonostoc geniculatum HA4340-LM1]|jgi:hypothetical protein|nr:hypothetical protein [Desmonostoc geniculatum HA4340-LM1]